MPPSSRVGKIKNNLVKKNLSGKIKNNLVKKIYNLLRFLGGSLRRNMCSFRIFCEHESVLFSTCSFASRARVMLHIWESFYAGFEPETSDVFFILH